MTLLREPDYNTLKNTEIITVEKLRLDVMLNFLIK